MVEAVVRIRGWPAQHLASGTVRAGHGDAHARRLIGIDLDQGQPKFSGSVPRSHGVDPSLISSAGLLSFRADRGPILAAATADGRLGCRILVNGKPKGPGPKPCQRLRGNFEGEILLVVEPLRVGGHYPPRGPQFNLVD